MNLRGRFDAVRLYQVLRVVQGLLFGIAAALNPVYRIETVGLDAFQLVILGTILEITIFSCEVPTGVVADTVSRRLSVIIGYGLYGIAFLGMGLMPFFGAIVATEALRGLSETFISGAQEAWLTDEIPHSSQPERSAADLIVQGSQLSMGGRFVGVWIASALGLISLATPLIAAGVGFVILCFALWATMPEDGFDRGTHKGAKRQAFFDTLKMGWRMMKGRGVLMLIMILTLIYGMSSEAFDRLWNKLIIDLVGAPDMLGMGTTFFWGAINSVALLVTFGLTWLIRRKVDLDGKGAIARTLLTLTICLLVCLSLFGLSQTLMWASVAFLAVRAIRGAIAPLVVAWVNQRAEKGSRATLLSFEAQSHSFGEIMSGPTLGSIAQFVSIKAAMLTSAAMLAPALALLGIRAKKAVEEEG